MAEEDISLIMFEDCEGRRDSTVRWLTDHPCDALLFLFLDSEGAGHTLLVPWDVNLAMLHVDVSALIPYVEFSRQPIKAARGAVEFFKVPHGSKIEIPGTTSYPRFLNFVEEFSDFDIICREGGIRTEIERSRAIKDETEIKTYRQIFAMTDEIINQVEKNIRSGKLKTELDVAVFIDCESRKMGCEGTGFETIVAGPARSFGIHAFPAYTGEIFAGAGLSILDFGLKYMGYSSDVTLTVAREPLSKAQERMVSLVEKAYNLAVSLVKSSVPARNVSIEVERFFARNKKTMPHALGHGIGLEAHEAPSLRNHADNDWILQPGMIITIEPGLYDPVQGGCRLENDLLITDGGAEVMTNSRIIRL